MYILLLLLFIINPYFSTFISIYLSFKYNTISYYPITILFLSLFNITIDGSQTDYSWYLPLYSDALKTNFTSYIFSLHDAKEPLYTLFNYIVSRISNGNRILYSIISTSFFYFFTVKGLSCLKNYLKCNNSYLILSYFILFFFPYIFANSANLLRQYYATGIILFATIKILQGHKKYWILALCSTLFHTSSGLIVLLLSIPFFKRKLTFTTASIYLTIFIIFTFLPTIAEYILSFGSSPLNYALTKIVTGTTYQTEYSIEKMFFSIIATGIPYLIICITKLNRDTLIVRLANIQLFFLIYILSNLHQAELCERLNIYLWCFIPFNILIISSYFKLKKKTCYISSIILIIFFSLYELNFTSFHYNCRDTFFIQPAQMYFIQSDLNILK